MNDLLAVHIPLGILVQSVSTTRVYLRSLGSCLIKEALSLPWYRVPYNQLVASLTHWHLGWEQTLGGGWDLSQHFDPETTKWNNISKEVRVGGDLQRSCLSPVPLSIAQSWLIGIKGMEVYQLQSQSGNVGEKQDHALVPNLARKWGLVHTLATHLWSLEREDLSAVLLCSQGLSKLFKDAPNPFMLPYM